MGAMLEVIYMNNQNCNKIKTDLVQLV